MANPDSLFGEATEWLSQHGVGAVDWGALAAKRQDSVRNPAYMDQYLLPAFQRAARVADTLELTRAPPDDVLQAYSIITSTVRGVDEKAFEILKANFQFTKAMLFPGDAVAFGVKMDKIVYGLFVYHLWSSALTGANAHITGRIHLSGLSDEEIAYHASLTTMCFNLISWLNELGLLSPIKKSGLGAVPLLVVIVLGVVLIGAITWAVVAIYHLGLQYKVIENACNKAFESGDEKAIANCQQILKDAAPPPPDDPMKLLEKLSIVAMVGAGLYMAVLFGPGIAVKLKQTVAAYKAS